MGILTQRCGNPNATRYEVNATTNATQIRKFLAVYEPKGLREPYYCSMFSAGAGGQQCRAEGDFNACFDGVGVNPGNGLAGIRFDFVYFQSILSTIPSTAVGCIDTPISLDRPRINPFI